MTLTLQILSWMILVDEFIIIFALRVGRNGKFDTFLLANLKTFPPAEEFKLGWW
jgi:hypothetical protein